MKKYRNLLIIFMIIMITPFILNIFKKTHNIKYNINKYNIKETYNYKNKKHYYDFIIKNNKEEYSYTTEKNINKKKKIINNIKVYKEKNITCIKPSYIKTNTKEIYCLKDNNQVSNYYLKDNKNYKKILSKLKIKEKKEKTNTKEYKKILIYKNNIPDNYKIIIWNYKGIYVISKDNIINQKFLNYDLYDNIMSTITSRYYVLFENTKVSGIKNIHYYDLKKNKYKVYKPDIVLSKKSYINGVYKDIIYVTDKEKMIQYSINIKKQKIEEVGNKDLGYIKYIDGNKNILSKYEFFKKEQYFTNEKLSNKKITNSKDIIKKDNYYYFKENNKIYSNMESSSKKLLFEMKNINSWNLVDDDIVLTSKDSLYLYNDKIGLKKVIKYNELNYNYNDIYKIWK